MTRAASVFRAEDLATVDLAAAPVIRPDGGEVAYLLQRADASTDATHSSVWLISTGSAGPAEDLTPEPKQLTSGPSDSEPVWFPDGLSIAFLRASGTEPAQLHRIHPTGGEAQPLTKAADFPFGVGRATMSPDGSTAYFAAPVPIDATYSPRAPIVVNSLSYKYDGAKYDGAGTFGSLRQHIFALKLADGGIRQLTDGDWHAGEPAISADGARLAFSAARGPQADLDLTSNAWYLDLADPALEIHKLGQAASVQGALLWQDESVLAVGQQRTEIGNAALWRLFVDGRPDEELSAGLDRNVMLGGVGYPGGRPQLGADGEIYFCVREGGNTNLMCRDPEGGISTLLGERQQVVAGLSHAQGVSAVLLNDQRSFAEIAVLREGEVHRLTNHTKTSLPEVDLIVAQPREFTISDGQTVHGWLIRSDRTEGAAPTLLDVHGGPHNAWTGTASTMHPYQQSLAAAGWNILMLNPRGSDGYGEAFMRAVWDAWGEADDQDFMQPLDALIAEGLADENRLAVAGYSYGGFAVCDLTGKTDRFAAAVAGGLICDLRHLPGASDLGVFLGKAELAASDSTERAAELSPITRVGSVKTPTLILHGTDDQRCPVYQAEQWFAELRIRGVETAMVLYPGQSHAFVLTGPLSHRIDYSNRLIDWLQRHVGRSAEALGRGRVPELSSVPELNRGYWQHRLEVVRRKHDTPGAVFGVLQLDRSPEPQSFASGVTSIDTGITMDEDTLVQIGSISKTHTATLVMQLVEEGLVDLDAPIRTVLPDFALADQQAAETVTMRHLLTHTSGIDGDIFRDTGRGDDCVQKYVDSLGDAEQLFAPGESWSYCNTGFIIAGRVVEVLRGKVWDEVLQERIFEPLGLEQSTTLAEQTALHRFAVGHLGRGAEQRTSPEFTIMRSTGPAGLITSSSNDVLRYARAVIHSDPALLQATSWAELVKAQVDVSATCPIAEQWALGWCLPEVAGGPCLNHNGSTFGQNSFLYIFPEAGVALFFSANGGNASAAFRELGTEVAAHFAAATLPVPFVPDGQGDSLAQAAGHYEAAGSRFEVHGSATGLRISHIDTSGLVTDGERQELEVREDSSGHFGTRAAPSGPWTRGLVEEVASGRLIHLGTRAYPQRRGGDDD